MNTKDIEDKKSIQDELSVKVHQILVTSGYNEEEDMDSPEFWDLVRGIKSLLSDVEKEKEVSKYVEIKRGEIISLEDVVRVLLGQDMNSSRSQHYITLTFKNGKQKQYIYDYDTNDAQNKYHEIKSNLVKDNV